MTATTPQTSSPTSSSWYRSLTAHLDMSEPYGPGWHALYHVSQEGERVGVVERDHNFTGSRIVQTPHFHAACRVDVPEGGPACWNTHRETSGYRSLRQALVALYRHISEVHR